MRRSPCWVLLILLMLIFSLVNVSSAEECEIRIHTFAVPTMNKVNVRREPAGSIRATIDRDESVYILDTTVKRGKTWCRVILFREGWYQALGGEDTEAEAILDRITYDGYDINIEYTDPTRAVSMRKVYNHLKPID